MATASQIDQEAAESAKRFMEKLAVQPTGIMTAEEYEAEWGKWRGTPVWEPYETYLKRVKGGST